MDELTLLSEFRSAAPGPSADEIAGARDLLSVAMAGARTARAPRPGHRTAAAGRGLNRGRLLAVAATCAAAAAVAAAVVVAPGQRTTRPEHRPLALNAADVLRKAASAAAGQAVGHGRFFVSESEFIIPGNGQDAPAKRIIWIGNGVTGRLVESGPFHGTAPIPTGISLAGASSPGRSCCGCRPPPAGCSPWLRGRPGTPASRRCRPLQHHRRTAV